MIRRLFPALAAFALCLAAVSCNDDKTVSTPSYNQFATLVSTSEQSGSVFEVQNGAYTPVRTLYADVNVPASKAKPGERVAISYMLTPGTTLESSGDIRLLDVVSVINGKIEEAPENINTLSSAGLQDVSMFVTGNYLNFQFVAYVTNEARSMKMLVDPATLNDATPTVYVTFEPDNTDTGRWKQLLASFDISAIWNNMKYQGMIVKLNNENGPNEFVFTFNENITPVQ